MKWKKEHKVPNSKGRASDAKNPESNSNDSEKSGGEDDAEGTE